MLKYFVIGYKYIFVSIRSFKQNCFILLRNRRHKREYSGVEVRLRETVTLQPGGQVEKLCVMYYLFIIYYTCIEIVIIDFIDLDI